MLSSLIYSIKICYLFCIILELYLFHLSRSIAIFLQLYWHRVHAMRTFFTMLLSKAIQLFLQEDSFILNSLRSWNQGGTLSELINGDWYRHENLHEILISVKKFDLSSEVFQRLHQQFQTWSLLNIFKVHSKIYTTAELKIRFFFKKVFCTDWN